MSFIMRNKPSIDNLDIYDMYNNLKVCKADIKSSSRSSSNSHNVAFVSAESTISTNEFNVAYSVSTAIGHSSQAQEQIDQDDLEEMDLKWQVAMLSMRVKFARNSGNRSRDTRNAGYIGRDNDKRPAKEEDEKGLLDEALREKEDLKAKVKKFETSSKNLTKLLDSQISAKVKTGLGYDSQFNEKEVLDIKEEEVTKSMFDNRSSDEEHSLANDRFKKGEGYHVVPPHLTGNYMPPKPDLSFAGLDDFLYKFKIRETVTSLAKDKKDAPETSTVCVENPKEDRSHLVKDCTFHKDRMAKKSVLPNNRGKGTGHRDIFTRSGRIPVSVAKLKVPASTSASKPINTAGPKQSGHPHQALKNKGIVDSGCSRHMTGNKAYLLDYQEINDGDFVAFGSSKDNTLVDERLQLPPKQTPPELIRINALVFLWTSFLVKDILLERMISSTSSHLESILVPKYTLYLFFEVLGKTWALVIKTHNKTPYELLNGRSPRLDFMRPFGCPVTILNTLDPLGKFTGKADEGLLVGYFVTSKAFRSSDDKVADDKPKDDTGSKTIQNPVNKEDQAYRVKLNRLMSQEKEASDAVDSLRKEFEQGCMDQRGATKAGNTNSFNTVSNPVNAASTSGTFSAGGPSSPHLDAFIPANAQLHVDQDDSQIPYLEDTADLRSTDIFNNAYDDDLDIFNSLVQSVGAETDFNNIESSTVVNTISTHRVHIDHPKDQILGDPKSAVQTRGMVKKNSGANAFVSYIHKQRRTNHKDYENYLFACFLSQMEPKKVYMNKKDKRGIVVRNKARLVAQGHRQEEGINYDEVFAPVAKIEAIGIFLSFASYMGFIVYQMDVKSSFLYGTIEKEVYVSQPPSFIDLKFPNKVYKVYKNKKDERGIVVRNKARLVAQGHRQEEGIDYDEVFANEVYVCQPPRFIDPRFSNKVYKVEKARYGLHQAPRAWYETLSTFLLQNEYRRGTIDKTLFIKKDKDDIMLVQVYVDDIIFGSTKKSFCDEFEALMHKRFQMSFMGELTFFLGLQVKQSEKGIFISQDKYVAEILKQFDFSFVKTASTSIETQKPLVKDEEATYVDVYLYRSMIGSLMYLTASRPDIMFAVCACSGFQVTPNLSHLHAVKRIFRKSTIGGCQFLGRRLISWQCKKQTIVATSTTEAEYVAAANYCG
nr:hypothetical protein [Tanacetum cinerariifolium]